MATVSRANPDPDEALADAPFVPWSELYSHLRVNFRQGEHVTVVGPTGTGKTHLALTVAEIRSYVLVIACKPKDELVEDTIRRGYYLVPGNELEVPYVDGRPHYRRVVYWPRLPRGKKPIPNERLLRAERAHQRPLVAGALGYVRRNGHWAIVLDEGTWVYRDLGLSEEVDSALTQFRTLKASVIILAQRPAWTGRYSLSQASHLFLFQTAHTDDLKALGDISGVDTKLVQTIVRNLDHDRHEFLYIDVRRRDLRRSIAPPR